MCTVTSTMLLELSLLHWVQCASLEIPIWRLAFWSAVDRNRVLRLPGALQRLQGAVFWGSLSVLPSGSRYPDVHRWRLRMPRLCRVFRNRSSWRPQKREFWMPQNHHFWGTSVRSAPSSGLEPPTVPPLVGSMKVVTAWCESLGWKENLRRCLATSAAWRFIPTSMFFQIMVCLKMSENGVPQNPLNYGIIIFPS